MNIKRQKSNFINEDINPCIKVNSDHLFSHIYMPNGDLGEDLGFQESELSAKCLEDNNYEQEKCVHYFKNYQVCKQFWGKVYNARRKKGIRPYMPGSVEREKIVKEVDETNKFVYSAV